MLDKRNIIEAAGSLGVLIQQGAAAFETVRLKTGRQITSYGAL